MPAVRRYMRSLRERQTHVAAMLRTKGWTRRHIADVLCLEVAAVDDLLASHDRERALGRDLRETMAAGYRTEEIKDALERKYGERSPPQVIDPATATEGLAS